MSKGLVMLPVELIDDNGIMLKKCVMQLIELWGLGDEFKKWVDEACGDRDYKAGTSGAYQGRMGEAGLRRPHHGNR